MAFLQNKLRWAPTGGGQTSVVAMEARFHQFSEGGMAATGGVPASEATTASVARHEGNGGGGSPIEKLAR
ncbi:hypothetical protein T484DRAFT_1780647 [Baffinella frigidus]|nr:hypothetical protein T484DRAFT_1835294 [Cryptophyta sp. CCMP2293]KAJ1489251.1 hypothetical protein T484DRAFT_1780647 [Cryptophyta sp. CCMP2293]